MNPEQEKLLSEFDSFELDFEVEQILAKVKKECTQDKSIGQFAKQLEDKDRQKRAAQAEREARVQQQWSPAITHS